MNQRQQRQHDALLRVEDFVDSHAATVGVIASSEGRAQLQTCLASIAAHAVEQGTAHRRIAGEFNTERKLTEELLTQHITPIATFARARLRGTPGGAALATSCRGLQGVKLVHAARSLATAAAPYANELTRGGFPADAIEQLVLATDALEAAIVGRANIRVARVGATKGIESQLLSGREAVTMLHAVISRQFADDPTFLAAWDAARRVKAKSGAVRSASADLAAPQVVAAA